MLEAVTCENSVVTALIYLYVFFAGFAFGFAFGFVASRVTRGKRRMRHEWELWRDMRRNNGR